MTEISADVAYLLAIHRDRSNCNELKVELSYEKLVVNGQHRFPIELTKQRPTIEIQRDEQQSDSCLTLVMIDPDAPSSDNPKTGPFVHWIVSNVQRSDQQELCESLFLVRLIFDRWSRFQALTGVRLRDERQEFIDTFILSTMVGVRCSSTTLDSIESKSDVVSR